MTTRQLTIRQTTALAAVLFVLPLAACSKDAAETTPATSTSQQVTSAPSTAQSTTPASQTTTASPAPDSSTSTPASSSTGSSDKGAACKLLTAAELTAILGVKYTATPSSFGGSPMCNYNAPSVMDPLVTSQVTAMAGNSFEAYLKIVAGQVQGAKTSEVTIAGASRAVQVQGTMSQMPTSIVCFQKEGTFHQVIVNDSTAAGLADKTLALALKMTS